MQFNEMCNRAVLGNEVTSAAEGCDGPLFGMTRRSQTNTSSEDQLLVWKPPTLVPNRPEPVRDPQIFFEETSKLMSLAMKDGLYGVVFTTPLGQSSGIVHLTRGKVIGGGSSRYYYGTYLFEEPDFSATILVEDYTQGTDPVFGRDRMTIDLAGAFYGVSARFVGTSSEVPGFSLSASMTRLNTGSLFDAPTVLIEGAATDAKGLRSALPLNFSLQGVQPLYLPDVKTAAVDAEVAPIAGSE